MELKIYVIACNDKKIVVSETSLNNAEEVAKGWFNAEGFDRLAAKYIGTADPKVFGKGAVISL